MCPQTSFRFPYRRSASPWPPRRGVLRPRFGDSDSSGSHPRRGPTAPRRSAMAASSPFVRSARRRPGRFSSRSRDCALARGLRHHSAVRPIPDFRPHDGPSSSPTASGRSPRVPRPRSTLAYGFSSFRRSSVSGSQGLHAGYTGPASNRIGATHTASPGRDHRPRGASRAEGGCGPRVDRDSEIDRRVDPGRRRRAGHARTRAAGTPDDTGTVRPARVQA